MQNRSRSLPLTIAAGVSILSLVAGSAVAWWNWTATRNPSPPTPSSPIAAPSSPSAQFGSQPSKSQPSIVDRPKQAPPRVAAEKLPQVYWLNNSGSQIQLVASPASTPSEAATPLKFALTQLLAGPNTATVVTTIPAATRLRSVAVRADGIHVDLSQAFRTGGGAASMTARVAQVLYTATSLDPDAPVWLSVEGKPIESLGGEGLMLEQPLTRKRFQQDFSL